MILYVTAELKINSSTYDIDTYQVSLVTFCMICKSLTDRSTNIPKIIGISSVNNF